jgi:allophanate hydrolase
MTAGAGVSDAAAAARAAFSAFPDPAVAISLVPEPGARAVTATGALAGMPFAVKDNIDVAGAVTTAACPPFAYEAASDATVVERLRAAGAVPVAKTNLDQFATGLVGTRSPYGTPRNPVDGARIPGGSSSGSAVAVAAGLVPFALGTDTAGSGRVPAALNGIVGLKPSPGALSTRGIVPAVRSLDCPSVFAATVATAWTVFNACVGYDDADPYSRAVHSRGAPDATRARVGVVAPDAIDALCDEPEAAAYRAATDRLHALGLSVGAVDLDAFLAAGRLLYDGPWVAERYAAVGKFLETHCDDPGVDPTVAGIVLAARRLTAVDAYRGAYRIAELARETQGVWNEVDAIVVPTVPSFPTRAEVAADPVGVNARLGTFTSFVNLLDLCAIAVPGPARADGLPTGVCVIAPAGADALVAELGARFTGEPPLGTVDSTIELAVVGAHLRGQPLEHQLTGLGATFCRAARTAPSYRLYALPDTAPPKPGLVRVEPGCGGAIEVETWRLEPEAFGRFVAGVPGPLCIGTVELDDGSTPKGFLCEPLAVAPATDITAFGGWRAWLTSRP